MRDLSFAPLARTETMIGNARRARSLHRAVYSRLLVPEGRDQDVQCDRCRLGLVAAVDMRSARLHGQTARALTREAGDASGERELHRVDDAALILTVELTRREVLSLYVEGQVPYATCGRRFAVPHRSGASVGRIRRRSLDEQLHAFPLQVIVGRLVLVAQTEPHLPECERQIELPDPCAVARRLEARAQLPSRSGAQRESSASSAFAPAAGPELPCFISWSCALPETDSTDFQRIPEQQRIGERDGDGNFRSVP